MSGEIVSDKVAANISGLTRDEYIELFDWLINTELVRLHEKYVEYLSGRGVTEGLPNLEKLKKKMDKSFSDRLFYFDKKLR